MNKVIMVSSQEEKFISTLQNSLSPFENFVAKLDIEEPLSLTPSRGYIIKKLVNLLDFNNSKTIIPIAGNIGQGKTFICWELKKNLKFQGSPIFFEVPANAKMFYYDLYTKIIEEIGAERLREISTQISNRWGASEIKYGLYRTTNTEKVFQQAIKTPRYKWSQYHKELNDCIRAIIIHAMDPEKSPLAERWLLGEIMDNEELFFLGIESNLSAKYVAKELLKLLANYLDDGIILIYDDLDKNWEHYSSSTDLDDDWCNELEDEDTENDGLEEKSSDKSGILEQLTFFEQLALIQKEIPKVKIVFTMDYKSRKEILAKFPSYVQSKISNIIPLNNFSSNDTKEFFKDSLKHYIKRNNLSPDSMGPYFPLSEKIIKCVFFKTEGNPRQVIRKFQLICDDLVFDNLTVGELENKYCH